MLRILSPPSYELYCLVREMHRVDLGRGVNGVKLKQAAGLSIPDGCESISVGHRVDLVRGFNGVESQTGGWPEYS